MSTPRRKPGLERLADIIPDAVEGLHPSEEQQRRLARLFEQMAAKEKRRDPTMRSIRVLKGEE